MSILRDRIRPLDPSSLQVFLVSEGETEADGEAPVTSPEPDHPVTSPEPDQGISPAEHVPTHVPVGRTSFELASRGGYVRTVTGTVAYLDEEAETYMVLRGNGDGELLRVPLRDITSAHEMATQSPLDSGNDAEGLGTGQ
jgi:hypothetical protein